MTEELLLGISNISGDEKQATCRLPVGHLLDKGKVRMSLLHEPSGESFLGSLRRAWPGGPCLQG